MRKQHWSTWLPVAVICMSLFFAILPVSPGKANDGQVPFPVSYGAIQPAALRTAKSSNEPTLQEKVTSTELLTTTVTLPIVLRDYPWISPFGAEVSTSFDGSLLTHAEDLGLTWIRLHRVSWRKVQPVENGPYDWSVLSSFENELRAAKQARLIPIVVVHHTPSWATINDPYPTDCGAIRPDKLDAFAAFMQALVNRYKQPQFDVHYWELGNEPDVDPSLVDADSIFGCWGDINDPYYGGREYGEMLKVATPAIRAIDPTAKVLVGGLLLARPQTTDPGMGTPEYFLDGILKVGAGPYFDILPYHVYPSYAGQDIDYDTGSIGHWTALGGWTIGKARFLRQTMAKYGIDKPLLVDETALGCNNDWYTCDPPPANFFEAQADYIPRTFSRGLSEGIQGFVWYTLNGPGWRNGGLLDATASPRPSFAAYQSLITRLYGTRFQQKVDYGPGIEAYSFTRGMVAVHVAWSIDTTPDTITVPQSTFMAAYDRDGSSLLPTPVDSNYQFSVGFSPIYLELKTVP
jgi:hypothetical protein